MDVVQTNAFGPMSVATRPANRPDLEWTQSCNFGYESVMQAYVQEKAKKMGETVNWVSPKQSIGWRKSFSEYWGV